MGVRNQITEVLRFHFCVIERDDFIKRINIQAMHIASLVDLPGCFRGCDHISYNNPGVIKAYMRLLGNDLVGAPYSLLLVTVNAHI